MNTSRKLVSLGSDYRSNINALDHERHSPVLGCEGRFPISASFDHDSETDREQVIARGIRASDRIAFRCGSRSVLEFRVVNGCTAFTAIKYSLANDGKVYAEEGYYRDGSATTYGNAKELWKLLEELALSGLGFLSNHEVGYNRGRFSIEKQWDYLSGNYELPLNIRTDGYKERDFAALDGYEARELGEDPDDLGGNDVLEDDLDVVCSWIRYWEAKVSVNLETQASELEAANKQLFKSADADETAEPEESPAPRKRGRPRLSDAEKQARAAARMHEEVNIPPVKLRGVTLAWPAEGALSLKGFRG